MMFRVVSFTALLALLGPPVLASAQGLAAVAKKEEERRKTAKAGKVYGNGDLKADITASPPPPGNSTPSAPQTTPAPGTQVPSVNLPGGKVESEEKTPVKDEAYWRARISAARSALERSRIFADALQSRLNALATDFVNRDDPAQRSQIEMERRRAQAEQDRVKKEIADQTKAIADIEEEARKAGVPPGWLR
jgi:hypothetical protein